MAPQSCRAQLLFSRGKLLRENMEHTATKAFDKALLEVPGFQFVDHVAIAIRQGELDQQVKVYEMLGFHEIHREEVYGSDQVREALLQIGEGPNLMQLLEPLTPESPVAKGLEKQGGRNYIAHVGFRVKSAQAAFEYMQKAGFRIIDKAPRKGSRGTTVFF